MTNLKLKTNGMVMLEVLVAIFVIAVLAGAYQVYTSSLIVSNEVMPTTTVESEDKGTVDDFTIPTEAVSTSIPTQTPLQASVSDEEIQDLIAEVNSITDDINLLDEVGSELDLPSVDFSL